MTVQKAVGALLKKSGNKKIAIVWCFACHGVQANGMQAVVVNEYNQRLRYYKLWYVENMIRKFARSHPNSFHLSIFACCREVFENNKDCVPGPYNVAIDKLNERVKAIEMVKQQA